MCETMCLNDQKCNSWTYVIRGPAYADCCLKGGVQNSDPSESCTSGEITGGGGLSLKDNLVLLDSDKEIEIRVFVDNTFLEAYWMDGRIAMTSKFIDSDTAVAGVSAFSIGGDVVLKSLDVYTVKNIWVTPEEVLNTPRTDLNNVVIS